MEALRAQGWTVALGMAGGVMLLVAYAGNVRGRFPRGSTTYLLLNLIGSGLLVVSLVLPLRLNAAGALFIEAAWFVISLHHLLRRGRAGERTPRE